MCGFVGLSGRIDPTSLSAAVDAIRHRGPDGSGLFVDAVRGIGLGHVRLSILDTSAAGHQPMSDPEGAVTLVYNGEIYNFVELRESLRHLGHAFVSGSERHLRLRAVGRA